MQFTARMGNLKTGGGRGATRRILNESITE